MSFSFCMIMIFRNTKVLHDPIIKVFGNDLQLVAALVIFCEFYGHPEMDL